METIQGWGLLRSKRESRFEATMDFSQTLVNRGNKVSRCIHEWTLRQIKILRK